MQKIVASKVGFLASAMWFLFVGTTVSYSQGLPVVTTPIRQPGLIGQTNQPGDSSSGSAQVPSPPSGGFGALPPSRGREDVSQRMNLNGADAAVNKFVNDADNTLGGMVKNVVTLDPPAVQNQSDLQVLQSYQRNIQILTAKERLAEIAVKYWGTVYNNEHAKAWRQEEAKKKQVELDYQKKMAEIAPRNNVRYNSVPTVYEIVGSRATLLVPGSGIVYAHSGSILPNGTKVISVGGKGVEAEIDGRRQILGFTSK